MRKEAKKEPKSIEIHFGDIFENTFEDKTRRYVIVSVGEENYCYSSKLMEEDNKLIINPVAGTTGLLDIHRATGERLTLEQIINGVNNYFGKSQTVSERIVQILTEESQKSARLLIK